MANTIHPTAIVHPDAELADHVVVGAYAVIEGPCSIGQDTRIDSHAVILPFVRMGTENHVFPHAVIGGPPQDLSYRGEPTWLEIGDGNILREGVTIHRATRMDRPTYIGSRNYLMSSVHIGHDCQLGDSIVIASGTALAGFVEIGSGATIGGLSGVHQWVRIGTGAMVGAMSLVVADVLPYSLAFGVPARHAGPNQNGLRRAGWDAPRLALLDAAFAALAKDPALLLGDMPELVVLQAALLAPSRRGISKHRNHAPGGLSDEDS